MLLGLVEDLLHWQLKYLKARNIKNQFDNRFTLVARYSGIQQISKPFHSLKIVTSQGKEIGGMIRILAVNCTPMHNNFQDPGKTPAENTSYQIIMGAVRSLCQFPVLVSQYTHSDLSLKALDDPPKRVDQTQGVFREQTMLKSAKASVDDLLARESHHLCKHKIDMISAAMEALLYGAERVSTIIHRQFQIHLNRPQQAATTWSDADHPKAIEQLKHIIHQATPAKRKLVNHLVQCHE